MRGVLLYCVAIICSISCTSNRRPFFCPVQAPNLKTWGTENQNLCKLFLGMSNLCASFQSKSEMATGWFHFTFELMIWFEISTSLLIVEENLHANDKKHVTTIEHHLILASAKRRAISSNMHRLPIMLSISIHVTNNSMPVNYRTRIFYTILERPLANSS